MREKIYISKGDNYNSKMFMDYKSLREMLEIHSGDYEFIEFLWEHISNNKNLIIGFIEPVNNDRYCFKYRHIDSQKIYQYTCSLSDIALHIRRKCGRFKDIK